LLLEFSIEKDRKGNEVRCLVCVVDPFGSSIVSAARAMMNAILTFNGFNRTLITFVSVTFTNFIQTIILDPYVWVEV